MIQCSDCEFCEVTEDGRKMFKCDPFSNIKEPECLEKMQIMRLDILAASYRATMQMQQQMAPMQDKIFKYVQREIDDMEDNDSWKHQGEDDGNSDF